MKRGRNSLFYIMFIVIVCLLWGVGNPVIKIGLGSLDVFYALGLRYVIAIVIFFAVFKKDLVKKLKRADRKPLAAVSFMTAAEFITGNLAIMLSSATVAGFLMCISIIFTPFLSGIMLKTRMDRKIFPVVILCVIGLYLLCCGTGSFSVGWGEVLALCCSLTTAISLIMSSKFLETHDAVTLSTGQCVATAAVSFVLAGVRGKIINPMAINATGWYCVIYLALGCTVLAYMLQNEAIGKLSPVYASVTFCLEPIFTALAAGILLKEKLLPLGTLGAVMIIIAIVITSVIISLDGMKKKA
ncbi:MAG: DMT family transporter [Firmicutes bacterium]|nr:DMT family transporter [Bacillota bacterium]